MAAAGKRAGRETTEGVVLSRVDRPERGGAWRQYFEDTRAHPADVVHRVFGRESAEPRPGFDRRFGKGVCLVRPDGVQVDLHRTLAAGPDIPDSSNAAGDHARRHHAGGARPE